MFSVIQVLMYVVIAILMPAKRIKSNLVLITSSLPDGGQFCPGYILTYECTACIGLATVWTGSALECDNGVNRISLLHSVNFVDSGECNGGDIVCYIVGTANGCYVSQMNVTMSYNVQEKSIKCSVDDGRSRVLVSIGNSVIPQIDQPSGPTKVHLDIPSSGQGNLTFSWTQHFAHHYIINATNCGVCPNVTETPTVECMDIEINDGRCEFSVHSVVCDTIVSNASEPVSFAIRVPMLQIVSNIAHYSSSTNALIGVHFNFIESNPLQVQLSENDYLPVATTYIFIYSDVSGNHDCGLAMIESDSLSCIDGICTHVFDMTSSGCPTFMDISVVAFARNLFGNGSVSGPYLHGGTSTFVEVHLSSSLFTPYMYCQFFNLNATSINRCFVQIYPQTAGEPCSMEAAQKIIMLKGANSSTDTIAIPLRAIAHHEDSETFCFSVLAFNSTFKVAMDGNFSIETVLGINEVCNSYLHIIISLSSIILAIFLFGATILIVVIIKFKAKVREETETCSTHNNNLNYEEIHLDPVDRPTTHTHNINTSENVAYESVRIRLQN